MTKTKKSYLSRSEKEYLKLLGTGIYLKRKEKKLTQDDLAKKVFLSRNQIHRIEDGQNPTNIIILQRIAKELGVALSELINIP